MANCYHCIVEVDHSKRVGALSLAAFHTRPMLPQFPDLQKQQSPRHDSANAAPLAAASNLHGIFSWFGSHDRSKTTIGVPSMMSVESSPKVVMISSENLPTSAIVPLVQPPRIQPPQPPVGDSVQHPEGSCTQSCSASIPIVIRRRVFSLDKHQSVSLEEGASHESSENAEPRKEHGASKRLERIYDQRTWAMYSLITNARKRMAKCSIVQAASIQSMSDVGATTGGYQYPLLGPQQQQQQHNQLKERSRCLSHHIEPENDADCREDDDEDTCSLTSYSWDCDMVFELDDYR
jgi:hypothetical protein